MPPSLPPLPPPSAPPDPPLLTAAPSTAPSAAPSSAPSEQPVTHGALFARRSGAELRVYVFVGADAVVTSAPLPWRGVSVALAFSGEIASVVGEHGLEPLLQPTEGGATASVGAPGESHPGGLAFTVTFTPETDVGDARIEYASSDTWVESSAAARVTWAAAAAFVVQDASHFVWLFTAGAPPAGMQFPATQS